MISTLQNTNDCDCNLPLIFAITLHEAAHGWVASKLGDKTACNLGELP